MDLKKIGTRLIAKIEDTPPLYLLTILFLAAFLVYGNSLLNDFVWDDEEQIVKNTIIHSLKNFPSILSGATFQTGGAGLSGWFFRPLLTFSFMINYALFRQNAFGFHLFQVFFHFLNGVLIFKIIQLLLLPEKSKATTFISFLVSLIFIVHPGISEAVSYISALSEVMYTFFNLLAIFLIVKVNPKFLKPSLIVAVSVFLFLGMLFKESAIVVFPIIIAFLLIYRRSDWKRWLVTLGVVLSIYLFVRLVLTGTPIRSPEFSPISEAPLWERLLTVPLGLLNYLRIAFYPAHLAISQHFVVRSLTFSTFLLPLLLDLIFAGFLFFVAWRLKSKLVVLGLLWFGLGFSLISNLFPLDMTIAERWLYFPMIGIMFILAALLNWLFQHKAKLIPLYLIFLVGFIVTLSVRTVFRSLNWHDGLTLYTHDIKISQNSFDLENNLGVELFRKGQVQEAKVHFERSIKLQPKWHFAYNNLGAVYQSEGNLNLAKNLYQLSIEKGNYYLAYENLAQLRHKTEKPEDLLPFIESSLGRLPNNEILNKIASLTYYQIGTAESAKFYAQRAYLLNPSYENYSLLLQMTQNQVEKP